jgi:hypothetical protein
MNYIACESWTIRIGPIGCPETSVRNYYYSLRDNLEERGSRVVDCVWNGMAHAQKPDFVFRRNGRVHLNRRGRQFSRLLAGELCTSACWVFTARTSPCSAVMWRLLVTHSILLFPLHFSSRASPCAITFQTQSTRFLLFYEGSGMDWETVLSQSVHS